METRPREIKRWMDLIQAEYKEMPGLHLTKAQVRRLWGLDRPTCDTLLSALEETQVLWRTAADAYIRVDLER